MCNAVAYYRVSTRKQQDSGLGLAAQRQTVQECCQRRGLKLVDEYKETISGRKKDRPELLKAIEKARACRATLIVSKLDRLSRNAAFLLTLRDSGLPIVFADLPEDSNLTVGVLALVAEEEAKLISKRTKDALAQARKRGVKLGSDREGHWDGREDRRLLGSRRGAKKAASVHQEKADSHNAYAVAKALEARAEGLSWSKVAALLNEQNLVTRRGNSWTAQTIIQAVERQS